MPGSTSYSRFDIEDSCALLIATQAPMASDLRMLAAPCISAQTWNVWQTTPRETRR